MMHRLARKDKKKSINAVNHGNSKLKETLSLQFRRRTFSVVILGSLLLCYFISVVLLSKNHSLSPIMSENPLYGVSMGSEWKVLSSASQRGYTRNHENRQNQTVLLYIDSEISSEAEKSATNSLQSLVNQFGSRSLRWEVVHQAANQKETIDIARQNLPCVFISKNDPAESYGANLNGNRVTLRCIQMVPLVVSSEDPSKKYLDWKLHHKQGSVGSTKSHRANSTMVCLAHQVGPRPDFWQRGVTFARVGLWVQSASIRSHVWNLALLPEFGSASSLGPWLADTIRKLSIRKMPGLVVGRNASAFVVTKPMDEYKPVPYFRDLLTTVFTILIWDPDFAEQNVVSRGKKQRQKRKNKQSLGQHKTLFWKQLQEVILAGAIPIVVLLNSPKPQLDCNHDLFFHSTSPILTVSNQEDRLQDLLKTLSDETPTKWNERQIELRKWYQHVMIERALEVENWILKTAPPARVLPFEIRDQWAKEYWESSVPSFMEQRKYDFKPLCLTPPFYGRTNNKVIEIGKLLKLSCQEGKRRPLALDRRWSNWYRPHFDERPDILLDYYPHGECEKVFTARESFEIPDWDLSYLIHLLPRHDYRERAEKILNTWRHGKNYISVHRRDLEGSCHVHARCSDVELETSTCLQKRDPSEVCSVDLRLHACDMEYDMVPNPQGLPIVLFTDGQVPAKDATFPHIFNTSDFFVEMWLMVNSQTHWGNPRSTVDAVVASWRGGRGMEPKKCYPS